MAEHMTAEQLRAELERIADFMDRLVDTDIDSDGPLDPGKTYYVTVGDEQMATHARELRAIAARLSGMAAVPASDEQLRRAYRAGVDDARAGLSTGDYAYYDEPSKDDEDEAVRKILGPSEHAHGSG